MEGSITVVGKCGILKGGGQYLNELEYQNIEGYTRENLLSAIWQPLMAHTRALGRITISVRGCNWALIENR